MASRLSDNKLSKGSTKQIRIDEELHRQLKVKASSLGESMKGLLEEALAELLSPIPFSGK
jgi:predicted HicB family RNase H-like nuclease